MTFPSRWQVPAGYSTTNDPDVFPVLSGQNFISKKSPKFPATTIKTAVSGREVRYQTASQPTWDFKVSYEFMTNNSPTASDLQTMFAFFLTRNGQAQPFFFYDPYDNQVPTQYIGTGNGSTTSFQLMRTINPAGYNGFVENIYAVLGTPTVTINGTSTSAYTIGANGVITFTTAPASGATIYWTGQFLFLCRFAQDNFDAEQMTLNLWSNKGLEFASFHP